MTTSSRLRWRGIASALLILTFAFLAFLAIPSMQNASAYSDLALQFDGPGFAAKLEKVPCTLTVSGGPAGDVGGNFTYKAEIVADNKTGSSVTPSTGASSSGVFRFNVTMPGEAGQTIKVKVNVTSKDPATGDEVDKVREFEIEVVDPIIITATVYNVGSVEAKNVTAKFYVDDIYLGKQVFDILAGGSKKLTYNWTWLNIGNGEHTVKVVLDDANDLVEFSSGNNVYTMTVYIGKESNPLGAVLTVGVIVMFVFTFLTYLQKPARKKK
ncbi:MAG TPA: CARDB domain-containing protein [Thermoplasmata archaeon]|nr:CARDB domain-containing protein [Thermoplasmata archaeon]